MNVIELWRYPVKSLQGERLTAAFLGVQGLEGDRRFAIYDLATGFGLTARRLPELLFASARLRGDGRPEITLPDGSVATDDAALSAWLGRPVELRTSASNAARRYENVDEFELEPLSHWSAFEGAAGAFHDSPGARVSLVSQGTIGSWDARRFRANIVLDAAGEDAFVGSALTVGEASLEVGMRITRCVMTTRAQPGGVTRDLDVLRTIVRERGAQLAIGAIVAGCGTVRLGDTLAVS